MTSSGLRVTPYKFIVFIGIRKPRDKARIVPVQRRVSKAKANQKEQAPQ